MRFLVNYSVDSPQLRSSQCCASQKARLRCLGRGHSPISGLRVLFEDDVSCASFDRFPAGDMYGSGGQNHDIYCQETK